MATCKKKATRLGAHIVFVDESGFSLIPQIQRTWSPRGQTPIHRHRYRRKRISAISGVSLSPRRKRVGLYYQLYEHNVSGVEVIRFLRHLLRHLRGHVIVVWDNIKTHKGPNIRALLQRFPRLHLAWLPPYAPELNPDEGVWQLSKRSLANGRPDQLSELKTDVRRELNRLKASPQKLRALIKQSELPLFLP